MKTDILRKPLVAGPDIGHHDPVIARLMDACDVWSFEILKHLVRKDEVVIVAKLTADGVVKMAFGGSPVRRDRVGRAVSLADDLKRAADDALQRAACLLGVPVSAPSEAPRSDPSSERRPPPAPVVPPISDRITSRQYNAVQTAARRRNIDREHLGGMIEERFKKPELAQLTRREASSLIAELSEANGTHA